jgi:nuclear protein localization family protein 4
MVKIGVQWARGLIKLDISLTVKVKVLIEELSKRTKVDPKNITLYLDHKFTKPIDPNKTVCVAKIKKGMIIYMKVDGEIPECECAQCCLPVDVHAHFLGDGKNVPTHDIEKARLMGPRVVTSALFAHREKLKPQFYYQKESSCFALRLGFEATKRFQNYAFQSGFVTHRIIFLFGRIDIYTGKVTVHCGMEPPQKNCPDHVEINPDFDMAIPLEIAKSFGMHCVGMAISHSNSDPKHPVTEYMVKLAAKYQNEFTEYFTTVIVTPIMQNGVASVNSQGFQVNDAAMKIDKEGLFDQSDDPYFMKFKEPVKFYSREYSKLDVNLALCAVRIRETKSRFPSNAFPSPSAFPSVVDVKKYFNDNQYCPTWYQLFDFNLLVYLVQNNAIPFGQVSTVVKQIIGKQPIEKNVLDNLQKYMK